MRRVLSITELERYYAPENKWLDIAAITKMVDNSTGLINAYSYLMKYVNVGCKHNCLISEFKDVLNYYKSLYIWLL